MTKKVKIIIAVVCSVLFITGLATGLYFGLKEKPQETAFAETGFVEVIDEDTIEFSYLCPYFKKADFKIINEKGFTLSTGDKTTNGKIVSLEYSSGKTDSFRSGTLTLTVDLEEKLSADTSYHAVVKAESIELKKEKYVNTDITADFKTIANTDGKLEAEEEEAFKDVKSVVLSNVKAELFKKDGKAYFSITAKANGITAYNESGMKAYRVFASYIYKTTEGTFARHIHDNVEFSAENGVITITGETGEENLIPGQDYKLIINKGFFTNDDQTLINEEYTSTFTYVEQ